MKIVLDTNVLVSAAISAYRWLEEGSGPTSKEPPLSLKIIGSVLSDILTLVVTEDIQNEYVAVMARKRFGQIDMAENKMPPEWFDRMLTAGWFFSAFLWKHEEQGRHPWILIH